MFSSKRVLTNTGNGLHRYLLASSEARNNQGDISTSGVPRLGDPANERERHLPKWHAERGSVYEATQRFRGWNTTRVLTNKNFIWVETVQKRVEHRAKQVIGERRL